MCQQTQDTTFVFKTIILSSNITYNFLANLSKHLAILYFTDLKWRNQVKLFKSKS